MPLQVHTARMGFRGVGWLDVTRAGNAKRIKSGEAGGHDGIGEAFAPSWGLLDSFLELRNGGSGELTDLQWLEYRRAFIEEMRTSYQRKRAAWNQLLQLDRVVLLCFCHEAARCHRRILASDILPRLGAINLGEITK